MKAKSIVSTGVNIAATTTAVTVQLPFDSSGGRPRYIRVTATGSAYVKLGGSNVVAVPGDLLVQPADGVMLVASGCTYISVITVSGSCAVSVAPTDDGRWDSSSPSASDVFRYYGKNANVYLPGVGVLSGLTAGNYIDSAGTTPGAVDQPVGLVLSATSTVNASQATAANRPILRRGALNLLLNSKAATNASWQKSGGTTAPDNTTVNFPNFNEAFFNTSTAAASIGTTWTGAFLLSGTGTIYILVARFSGGAYEETKLAVTLTSTPTLYAVTHTIVAAQTAMLAALSKGADGTATSVTFGGGALFAGTLTAAQIQALGGIPLTTTAPASTALGPYSWDTSGGKSFAATFPAGNESVTVIDARPTGQVTATAQNVVGAYSINTNTNGRIIVNGALTAPDLLVLQGLANRLAGL